MKSIYPCLLFLAGNEIVSLFALLVIMVLFLADIMKERAERYE